MDTMRKTSNLDKLKPINVYVTDEEKKLIYELAEIENRSVSNLGKYLFMREVRKAGLLLREGERYDE